MSEVLKKFGRYFLLDQIAQGGMAEIYRARLGTTDGAGRLLVIKRIQAGFGANHEFLQMFKSEIKVTMGFNHSNIVQLYDFGEEQNQPYIAMEYVDGKNLRQFLNRFREMKQSFPVEFAAHIIEQSATGLHYAHSFKDKISGEPLNVVHRDISPQNIIISFEGNVKIIDFGIAKARTNSEHTRAGVIKGKPSYLSPEQISGESIDGRTDLFALGAVFWELLTGVKLFQGENDLAVLKLIESCTTTVRAPSEVNPNVPKELDQIVLRMLSRQPEKRFQTGEELSRALRRFMIGYSPDFNPGDVAQVAKEIFNKEIVEDRKRIQRLNDRVEQLLLNELPPVPKPPIQQQPQSREDTTTFVPTRATMNQAREITMEKESLAEKVTVEAPTIARTRGTQTPASSSYSRHTASQSRPMTGSYRQGSSAGGSGWLGWVAGLAAAGAFVVGSPRLGIRIPVVSDLVHGPVADTSSSKQDPSMPDPETAQNNVDTRQGQGESPSKPAPVQAMLKLDLFPSGPAKKISVNGQVIDPVNPVIQVNTGDPLELLIEREGFQSFRSEFTIHQGVLNPNGEYVKVVNLEPSLDRTPAADELDEFGYLTISSTPPSIATIFVDGKPFARKNVPVERMKVPPGDYEVRFYSPTLDMEDRQKFTVQKGRIVRRVVDLKRR